MLLASSSERDRSIASEKRSLAALLRTHGSLSVTDAVDIALDVCDELANAHDNEVVHGDLGLHRVRLSWPRKPKERVEIFALDEDDSAAFAFRASPVAALTAPEQRTGKIVDRRADVWAVGALLHWMVAGRPPASTVDTAALGSVPKAVAAAIVSCLSPDPTKRPESVDELSQAIGSFASNPPERFEALARRRAAREGASRARAVRGDVTDVLGRLDDAALSRELLAASDGLTHGSVVARSFADRILDPSLRSTAGSVVAPKPVLEARPLPPPRVEPAPAAAPAAAAEPVVTDKTVPMTPPVQAAPPVQAPAVRADSIAPVISDRRTTPADLGRSIVRTRSLRNAFAVAAAFALVLGMLIGSRIFGGGSKQAVTAIESPPAATAVPTLTNADAPASSSSAPAASTVASAAKPTAPSATAASGEVPVLTPDALPLAVVTPRSLPNAPAAPAHAAPAPRPTAKEEDEDVAPAPKAEASKPETAPKSAPKADAVSDEHGF